MEKVETAGYLRQKANDRAEANQNPMAPYYKPLIVAVIGLPVLILLVRFVSFLVAKG
jgi:hypothetical protein